MKYYKVGDKVDRWTQAYCNVCDNVFHISRCDEKTLTSSDLTCCECKDVMKVDAIKRDVKRLEKEKLELLSLLEDSVDAIKELNYRLAQTDKPEGFHSCVSGAVNTIRKYKVQS